MNKIVRYKARQIVQEFNQILNIDYLKTFAKTCRPKCYKLILVLAIAYSFYIRQYDVINAFIYVQIDKEIYVVQSKGFKNKDHPEKVCLLNKALYDLKQFPKL